MAATAPLRCVVYCRVSTEEQDREGTSLDSQERFCRERVAAQGGVSHEAIRMVVRGQTEAACRVGTEAERRTGFASNQLSRAGWAG